MKKIIFVLTAITSIVLNSCQKDTVREEDAAIECRIVPVGEITNISYESITKSGLPGYYLLMNVYVFDSDNNSYSFYASGAYSELDKVAIRLYSGNKYKFYVSYVSGVVEFNNELSSDINSFKYGDEEINRRNLYTGSYQKKTGYTAHPLFERFYCEYETGVIGSDNTTVKLNLKRCSAKLAITPEKLKLGKVRAVILFSNDKDEINRTLEICAEREGETADSAFSFTDATRCWNDDSYTETYTVEFYYVVGDTEVKFSTKELVFKRNKITSVKVSINDGLNENEHYLSSSFDTNYEFGGSESVEYNS